jgi:pimeloyl-ACP methyl ester carboxylesterase
MTKIVFSIIGFYVLLLFLMYFLQRSLIYFPSQSPVPTPQEVGAAQMQEVFLHTDDGLDLLAWYCPRAAPNKPTIVYFHGNAGHIGHRAILIKPFLTVGYGVLLVTYRGYSGNPGKPSEEGLYRDARAAMKFLDGRGISARNVLFEGESIGTAVAIQMATEYPVGGLVLQAPFTSLADVGQYHYPFFPVRWMVKDSFSCLEKARKIHAPVFILHGENDGIVPPCHERASF